MRFPRLSHLFHRRSKSDTAIVVQSRKHSIDQTQPKRPRPRSALLSTEISLGHGLDSGPSLFSEVLASIPVAPLPLSVPPPTPAGTSLHTGFSEIPFEFTDRASSLDSLEVGFEARIYELERALRLQREECKRIPMLETELQAERITLQETRESNNLLLADIAELQADAMRARKELFEALNDKLPQDTDERDMKKLQSENDRLKQFFEFFISSEGYQPVLQRTYSEVIRGRDPEEALVNAIQDAILQPDNVWHRLLEPVVGSRSQAQYLAQLNCTLRARRDAHDWRKRAKFWKSNAREGGCHVDTVTPSVSQLSDVVDELPLERQRALNALIEKLGLKRVQSHQDKEGIADAEIQSLHEDDHLKSEYVTRPPFAAPGFLPLTPITENDNEAEVSLGAVALNSLGQLQNNELPSGGCTTIGLPPVSTMSSISQRVNLEPLASVTFRERHAIKTSTSKHRRDSFASLLALTPSVSTSSHTSQRSTHRKTSFMGFGRGSQGNLACVTEDPLSPTGTQDQQSCADLSCSEPAPNLISPEMSFSKLENIDWPTSISPSGTYFSSNEHTPQSSRILSGLPPQKQYYGISPPVTPTKARPDVASSTSNQSTSTLAPRLPSLNTRPEARRSPSPMPDRTPSSHSPSTKKKSRLPVLKVATLPLQRTIRRLSISKPVLVDTTNAAATLTSSPERVTKNRIKNTKGAENENVVCIPTTTVARNAQDGGGSPSKKVPPMRFGLGTAVGFKSSKCL